MDSNWNRRTIKKFKEGFKVNKEIVKIRNAFHNSNLKNKIIMRDCVKNTKFKKELESFNGDLLLKDLKILHDNTEKCMLDIEEDLSKLVLHNDSDFKVNSKLKIEKITNENLRNKMKHLQSPVKKINKHNSEDNLCERFIRIECSNKTQDTFDNQVTASPCIDLGKMETNEKMTTQYQLSEELKNNIEHSFDSQDLRTLLVMMSMSKTDTNDELVKSKVNITSPKIDTGHLPEEVIRTNTLQTTLKDDDVADILNITPFKMDMDKREMKVAKIFLDKWKSYVVKRKQNIYEQRQACLNTFFDKLAKKKMDSIQSNDAVNKAKILARDYNTYQQRYQVQKHIIALQKAKLEEQNRLIEELKYNRIVEASRQSVDAMRDEIRKTYFDIDRQLKPKIKCLTNELKLQQIEEPSLVLHCLKVPRYLQRMEKRAREREEKHAIIRERRRQMEEERVRLKQQAELAKAEMDKEEKMRRIDELREKRRKEKIENIRRKQYAARLRSLIVMADLHYERTLKTKYIVQLRILLQIKRDNLEKAKIHYAFQLKKNVFLHWMWYTEDMDYERNYIAEDFDRKKKLSRALARFKLVSKGVIKLVVTVFEVILL
ncbi:hypothetical protein evm_000014 [Chilo suppressalis]|nr:hypothetical protein evm_000014 [Chilo suppressalis]